MPPRRLARPGRELVTLRVDGEDVSAVQGEPVAMSLLAAGRLVLGRSVKYHRARGAACFAGRCDGCLMRVDGAPSVRTCRRSAEHDLRLETQNVVGSAEVDLLAATDWFFPGGMNHHEMFTWAKPVNQAMQLVAREVAGIGTLPDEAAPATPVTRRDVDVLVVGAGASGLSAARVLAAHGLETLCVDEEATLGGWLEHTPDPAARALGPPLVDAAGEAGAELACGHTVIGLFDELDVGPVALLTHGGGLVRVRARAWVLAVGRNEGAAAFVGSDLPGVVGAEAAARVLAHGILPGEDVVVVGELDARAAELELLVRALAAAGARVEGPHPLSQVERADGRTHVTSVTLNDGGRRTKRRCDLLVVAPRTGAAYELAVQAGAKTELREGAFELVSVPGARATWIVGGAAGAPSVLDAIADGERAAFEIVAALGVSTASDGSGPEGGAR